MISLKSNIKVELKVKFEHFRSSGTFGLSHAEHPGCGCKRHPYLQLIIISTYRLVLY